MIHHRAISKGKGTRSRRTVVIFRVLCPTNLGSPVLCEGVRRFHRGSTLLRCYLISVELSLSSSLARLPASPWVTATISDRCAAPSAILFFLPNKGGFLPSSFRCNKTWSSSSAHRVGLKSLSFLNRQSATYHKNRFDLDTSLVLVNTSLYSQLCSRIGPIDQPNPNCCVRSESS